MRVILIIRVCTTGIKNQERYVCNFLQKRKAKPKDRANI